jgi:hypothetical protein
MKIYFNDWEYLDKISHVYFLFIFALGKWQTDCENQILYVNILTISVSQIWTRLTFLINQYQLRAIQIICDLKRFFWNRIFYFQTFGDQS